jgi:hypothetical protein
MKEKDIKTVLVRRNSGAYRLPRNMVYCFDIQHLLNDPYLPKQWHLLFGFFHSAFDVGRSMFDVHF